MNCLLSRWYSLPYCSEIFDIGSDPPLLWWDNQWALYADSTCSVKRSDDDLSDVTARFYAAVISVLKSSVISVPTRLP